MTKWDHSEVVSWDLYIYYNPAFETIDIDLLKAAKKETIYGTFQEGVKLNRRYC